VLPLRILHAADIHIGEMAFLKIDQETGINARGLDFLNSFKNVADIAIRQKVDVFLVAGDFFTKVNPHPRYLLEVFRKLKKVSGAGITTIIISGNHETPRISTTLNPLALLGEIEGVNVALEPTTFQVDGYDFVCVPSPSNFDESKNLFDPLLSIALQESKSPEKILASHIPLGQATTCSEVSLESFLGDCVDISQIPAKFRYVALGHIHRCQQVHCPNMPVYYSGSSERFEFNEEHDDKYALLVEIDDKTTVKRIKLPTRPMVTLVDRDCTDLSAQTITRDVLNTINEKKDTIRDCLVRVKLDNVDLDESRHIDWTAVKQELADSKVFDFKIQPTTKVPALIGSGLPGEYIFPPSKELELYVKNKKQYRSKRRLLMKLGNDLIKETMEAVVSEA
jgi:exonuclease SbcD